MVLDAVDTGMFGEALALHSAFWEGKEMDRPLLACNIGLFMDDRYPRTASAITPGRLEPEDIHVELFLEDCDGQYEQHRQVGDDYPFVGSPLKFVPWLEAIAGCPIMASNGTAWAEPFMDGLSEWRGPEPMAENAWARKLIELLSALAEHSRGRYPVSCTLMRGPFDTLTAVCGAQALVMDIIDKPDEVRRKAELCADMWLEVAKAQHSIIPHSADGYMDGDRGFRFWSPEKPIWLQDDAMAFLSPGLAREFVYPLHRQIASQFGAVGYHVHGITRWAIDELASIPEIDLIEIDFEDTKSDAEIEDIFLACKKIQSKKRLVAYRSYDDGFWPWLDRMLIEFPPTGLSIQTSVRTAGEGNSLVAGFNERVGALCLQKQSN